MKLHEQFKLFLKEHVNLNDTRLNQLTDSIEAVKRAVERLDWGPKIESFEPQGSWAHGTIIKPRAGKPFDADLLVFVRVVEGWTAKDYVNTLATELDRLPAYKDKVRRYSHCATIEYANERKIDLAPCVVGRLYEGQLEVCNRGSDEFERSEPRAYTTWVKDKNGVAGGNDLKKVTRLLKFLRDIKGNFTCPSFLFTTLLGMQVYESDRGSAQFADLTTTLKTLIGRLDDWLQARPAVPWVPNPKLLSEDQARGWDDTTYQNFRGKIHLYRGWIDEAYDEEDRDESIGKWRRVFGDDFASGEVKRAAEAVSESSPVAAGLENFAHDLVDRVRSIGVRGIPTNLRKLPHVRRPTWRQANEQITVRVSAQLQHSEHGSVVRSVPSAEVLRPFNWLKFTAVSINGLPISSDYRVEWRITNTGVVASQAKSLRGEFYSSDTGAGPSRTEHLHYRGVHFVEAFVVRKRDDALLGQSEPFYVVIE
ncbi:SMODS domain-containing nucleotidyltransferase [Achromobacter deleyi]|uniref:SMODS domain-containing nucleotidyltransferase n=1 Tax=Achromobacter deleyi TaxID=1353891 RepID=UPI001467C4B0|nr:nucleotidyltransferase [Achromobacter deleyi]CAB3837547.1 hypothetical protein LMG3412_01074 [Achromobacter deleyi]